jgi:hypothetical protein
MHAVTSMLRFKHFCFMFCFIHVLTQISANYSLTNIVHKIITKRFCTALLRFGLLARLFY